MLRSFIINETMEYLKIESKSFNISLLNVYLLMEKAAEEEKNKVCKTGVGGGMNTKRGHSNTTWEFWRLQ